MIQIDDKIISFDILEEYFKCDLNKCYGLCCYEGASGAPLLLNEIKIIKKLLDKIKKYLPEKNIKTIEKYGIYTIDQDGDYVTTLVNNKECVFAYRDSKIFKCAIEKAYQNGDIQFKKPISCHLFPIRIKKYKDFTAVNLTKVNICKAGFIRGKAENIKVFQFLKEPLERAFGKEFYQQLTIAEQLIKESKK